MAKIVLDSVVSGYNLGKINENFQKIEDALNDEVLYRDNPPGETNTVKQDIDMDGNSIINVGDLQVGGTFTVDGINFDGVNSAFIWRGAWSNLTAYAVSDAVSHDGSSYICITAHTGSTPPSVNWDLLASIGSTGTNTVLSTGITDSTATGRALITSVSPATARATLEVPPRATRIDVASVAGTVDLTTNAPDTDDIRITGALVITAFTVAVGRVIRVTAGGAFTLTNNANIVTQTGANIVCAVGDTFALRTTAANVVELLSYVSSVGFVSLTGNQTIAGIKTFSTQPVLPNAPVLETPTTTSGGSAYGYTSIPSWVNELDVMVSAVSTAGSFNVVLQIGSGSYLTTGYNGTLSQLNGATGSSANTSTSIPLDNSANPANLRHGRIHFTHMGGNLWEWDGLISCAGSGITEYTAGSIQLAGPLDRVQIMLSGATTFDGGTYNIRYKG